MNAKAPARATRLARAGLLPLVWSVAQNAAAVCVANDSQLAQALTNAESTATTIKLVQGTYDLHNTPWQGGTTGNVALIAAGSQVLGGYTVNCASRDIAVGNTMITNSSANPQSGIVPAGDLVIEGLTFMAEDGFYLLIDRYITGVPNINPGPTIQIRRNAFLNAELGGFGLTWGQGTEAGGTIRLVDNLIAGNANSCSLRIDVTSGNPQVVWINNTIADNAGVNADPSGACFTNNSGVNGPDYHGNGSLFAYNNIFYGNHGKDLVSDSSALLLVDNTIGASSFPTPDTPPSGTLTSDPALDANYHLTEAPPSPAIDSGTTDVSGGLPATDLPGRSRVVGSGPDRGAFESAVNNAFVQVVSSTANSGLHTLRAAIDGAITHGSGLITFDLGGCPQTITLTAALSPITVPLIINGYSQAGSSPNTLDVGDDATLCVILKNTNNATIGLQVPSTAADGTQVLITGLAFSNFGDAAIDLQAGSGHSVTGNRFGGSASGVALLANGIGIRLGTAAHDSTIGGVDSADRNIIGGAIGSGILLQGGASPPFVIGANNNQIVNNYIGVGWSVNAGDYTNLGNGTRGIHLFGHDNTISGNLIGNNVQAGILASNGGALNNLIAGNFIGADADGIALGNGNAGIHLTGDSGDAPAGNTIRSNVVAHNGDQGVWIDFGTQNKVRKNSIYANAALGIDLAGAGITPNDNDGALIGILDYANRGLNFPALTSAAGGYANGYVEGTLTTTGGDYTVDLHLNVSCDSSGNGQGQVWLGGTTVTVPATQPGFQTTKDFTIRIEQPAPNQPFFTGRQITATATDSVGNTSEFSACASYFNDTIFANGYDPPPA